MGVQALPSIPFIMYSVTCVGLCYIAMVQMWVRFPFRVGSYARRDFRVRFSNYRPDSPLHWSVEVAILNCGGLAVTPAPGGLELSKGLL